MSARHRPYGSWPTPVTTELLLRSAATVGGASLVGGTVWWSESRPSEGGRTQLVRLDPGGEPEDVLPEGANARTAVHEYGGAASWVHDGTVWYVDWSDQRLWRLEPGSEPVAVTAAAPEGGSVRWADGQVHPRDGRVVVVRETHPVGGRGAVDVRNEVVVLSPEGEELEVVVSGPDFVSDPRWSSDGEALCWLEWDHPDMPWDATRLKVRRAGEVRTVAGEEQEEGLYQPTWAADGSLWFCSDREDWWQLHRWSEQGGVTRVLDRPGEVGVPQWQLGRRRFAFLDDGRVVAAVMHQGRDALLLLDPVSGEVRELAPEVSTLVSVAAEGQRIVVTGASPTAETAVLEVDPTTGETRALSRRRDLGLEPSWFSRPEHVEFPGSQGRPTYAHFYPPTHPDAVAPDGELPPVLVTIHGGPTSCAVPALSLATQFWTSRGFAVVDVDYGGSTGYGRDYRNRLRGEWGVVDVEDCVAVVRWLAEQGRVDPDRALIRGGSAGGFTTLMALAVSDVFAAGADLFGVADVEALALETHKFESRYLDRLIAPYPEQREVYVERSPLSHLDGLTSPLVVLQGAEDKVVPPAQSEAIVAALREKGVPVAYRLYPGEQHGFRRAENIRDALHSELSFYAQVLGFDLPDEEGIETLEIENRRAGGVRSSA